MIDNYFLLVTSLFCLQIKCFNFFSCPGCLAKKFKTGVNARIIGEAFNVNASTQFFPSIFFMKLDDDRFEGNAVQWILIAHFILAIDHRCKAYTFKQLVELRGSFFSRMSELRRFLFRRDTVLLKPCR